MEPMKQKGVRDYRISVIRMLCTGMIVLLHICQQLQRSIPNLRILTDWLNLGLVMFFSISAFLYSRRKIEKVLRWYLHRYLEIIISAILVGGGTLLVFSLWKGVSASKVVGTVLSCVGLHLYAPNPWMFEQLWFLTYILFFYLTVPLIQRIPCEKCSGLKFWGIFGAVVLVAQAGTIVFERFVAVPILSVGVLLRVYLPYFVYKRYDINGKEIRPVVYIGTALSLVAVLVVFVLRYWRTDLISAALTEVLFIYTQTLTGSVLFYWVYKLLRKVQRYTLLLRLSDRYSYEIYLTHCLFIGYSTSVLWVFRSPLVGIGVALLLTAVSSVLSREAAGGIKKLIKTK